MEDQSELREKWQNGKIRGCDETAKTHPTSVNAFPQLFLFGEANAPAASFFEHKTISDCFSHALVSDARLKLATVRL
jgi:hypothetical protein